MTTTETFRCMGCEMRLSASAGGVRAARRLVHAMDGALTRFDPASELSRLNDDERTSVPVPALLRAAVGAALWAARRSGGMSDPTLHDAVLRAGYTASRAGGEPAALQAALLRAPARRPARPDPRARWRAISVDDAAGVIVRPPGLLLDLGGSAKGLAADAAASLLRDEASYVVDCAGDLRVRAAGAGPVEVRVEHPLTREVTATLPVRGAVATSGLGRRVWIGADGSPGHHLVDPARGTPAWTGLIAVTALAPTALEAETLAKAALLRGPADGRRLLRRHGGILVDDRGAVEHVGAVARVALAA